jgi:hypothetical protein
MFWHLIRMALLLLASLAISAPVFGADLRKLKEADVLKLIELQIRDDAIIERIAQTGLAFKIDDSVLERFQRAGASDSVLTALRGTNPDPNAKPVEPASLPLMLWAEQNFNRDCPLHSEITINGQPLDVISSKANKSIDGRLKTGWNSIVVKTKVVGSEAQWNQIHFRIGPVHKDPKSKKQVMEPVLWQFDNGTDWHHEVAKFTHRIGPDVREVTVSFNLYYAGPDHERTRLKEGDYVLTGHQGFNRTPPVTATLFINGTPLNSFLGSERHQLTITPLLKQGKNEIRIITNRVKNVIKENDFDFDIGGPAEYSATQSKYVVSPVISFKAITGWQQDQKSGQWTSEAKPDAESLERTLTFNLEQAPKGK